MIEIDMIVDTDGRCSSSQWFGGRLKYCVWRWYDGKYYVLIRGVKICYVGRFSFESVYE